MNPLEALDLQLRLEGLEVFDGNLLRQVEIVPGEEMPLMLLAHLADDRVVACYDAALLPELRKELEKQNARIAFPRIEPLLDLIRCAGRSCEAGHYKIYLFPEHYANKFDQEVKALGSDNPLVQDFGFGGFAELVYVIERGGRIASACVSSRENGRCGEAWVYTDPQYRYQGLAQQVVSVWARDMLVAGKVPFYSHKIGNTASAGLARRLGLPPAFEEIVISYAGTSFLL